MLKNLDQVFERYKSLNEVEVLGLFFINRLKTVFPGVSENPGVLRNSNNNPLYLLCFAAGNAKGAPIALNIANSLLKRIQ